MSRTASLVARAVLILSAATVAASALAQNVPSPAPPPVHPPEVVPRPVPSPQPGPPRSPRDPVVIPRDVVPRLDGGVPQS